MLAIIPKEKVFSVNLINKFLINKFFRWKRRKTKRKLFQELIYLLQDAKIISPFTFLMVI